MNIIKQTISKKFTKKYSSKIEPDPTFFEKCMCLWVVGIGCCSILGAGNGAYEEYRKRKVFGSDVVFDGFVCGFFQGFSFGIVGPFIAIGYLTTTIKTKIE